MDLGIYGVLHRCPLLDLPYFDVSTAFPPDIMHDLVERVIPILLHKVIFKAVCNKTVTVDMLNARLDDISKGIGDRPNAFRHLSPSGSITGSAAQK